MRRTSSTDRKPRSTFRRERNKTSIPAERRYQPGVRGVGPLRDNRFVMSESGDPAVDENASPNSAGVWSTFLVEGPAGPIHVRSIGTGHAVVMLPSLGRGASDFEDLAQRLAVTGYRAVAPEPRGIGGSTGVLEGVSMGDLADDAVAVIKALGLVPATVVGHAFGNRLARLVATRQPDLVSGLVLLACGGRFRPAPEHMAALRRVFDTGTSPEEHLAAVGMAFFAPGNDPSVWTGGWFPAVAQLQGKAVEADDPSGWWTAGSADVLVVQPADDVVALPANAHDIIERLGGRATLVNVTDAGHALLPEQPVVVADAVLRWLDERQPG